MSPKGNTLMLMTSPETSTLSPLLLKVGAIVLTKPRVRTNAGSQRKLLPCRPIPRSSEENLPEKSWKFHPLESEVTLSQKGNLVGEY